jgi:serine/threonine protein kinase/tetratricopeptide (TPR) repeat protein
MAADNSERFVLLNQLVDEIAARYRRGERPALQEYADRHPELADEIRAWLPVVVRLALAGDGRPQVPEPAAPRPAPALERLGDFRIIREVGRGGMGVVYEAEQESLGRHVALKVLPKQLLVDSRTRQRFEREARAAAKLHHTNIVPVFGVGEHDGLPYYVMQFIQGTGLDVVIRELARAAPGSEPLTGLPPTSPAERGEVSVIAHSLLTGAYPPAAELDPTRTAPGGLAEGPPAPAVSPAGAEPPVNLLGQAEALSGSQARRRTYWQNVARIGVQVADALEYAHKHGIVHRDIKPSNLLLDAAGAVWVTDFGVAKADDQQNLTHPGDILGTLRYMPPEAFEGRTDGRSDVYSLGLTLYELITLRPAFDEKDRAKLVKQVTGSEPPRLRRVNPQVPRDLATVVHKAIDRDPARRYQTCGELARDLGRFVNDEPVLARQSGALERTWRWCRRNPRVASLLAVVALLVTLLGVGGVTSAVVFSRQAREQRHLADEAIRAEQKAAAERQRALDEQAKAESEARRATNEAERANREAATATHVTNFLAGLFEPNQRLLLGAGHLGFRSGRKESLSASDLLKRGVDRLNASAELKGQPLVRARLLHEVGTLYFALGEVEAAAPLFEEALRLRRAELPGDHPDLAVSLRALGLLRYIQGDDGAVDIYREAVAILKKQPDPESLELAETESGLAVCLFGIPRYEEEAFALAHHALAIRRKRLGDGDPQTLLNVWMVAWCHLESGQPYKALPLLAEVLTGFEKSQADPDLVALAQSAAKALQIRLLQGDRASLPAWRETMGKLEGLLGDSHYVTLKTKRLLAGMIYEAYGGPDPALEEAVRLYEEGLKSGVLPKWEQGMSRLDLGRTQWRLGRAKEAEENARLAVPLLRAGGMRSIGELPHALQMLAILAERSDDPKRRAEVEGLLKEAVEVSRAEPNVPEFRKAHSFMDLGRYRLLRGDAATSEPLFAEAAKARAKGLGPTNFEVGEALAYQSAALRLLGRTEDAERIRARAEELLRPHRNNKHPAALRARLVLDGDMPRWP